MCEHNQTLLDATFDGETLTVKASGIAPDQAAELAVSLAKHQGARHLKLTYDIPSLPIRPNQRQWLSNAPHGTSNAQWLAQ